MMKKPTMIMLLTALCMVTFAQEKSSEDPSKTSTTGMPVAGDFAIGTDAVPYLEFLGNIFSGHNSRNTLNVGAPTLFARYYLTDHSAIRGELYINSTSSYIKRYVQDDANVAMDPLAQVEDARKLVDKGIGFGTGYQIFKGLNKVRGTVGVNASYYYRRSIYEYYWGNQMTAANSTPTSTNWYGAGTTPAARQLEIVNTGSHIIQGGIFAGFEYYFLPKISIGGELGIYLSYNWEPQEYYTYETIEMGNLVTYEQAVNPPISGFNYSTWMYDTGFNAGRLFLMIHF